MGPGIGSQCQALKLKTRWCYNTKLNVGTPLCYLSIWEDCTDPQALYFFWVLPMRMGKGALALTNVHGPSYFKTFSRRQIDWFFLSTKVSELNNTWWKMERTQVNHLPVRGQPIMGQGVMNVNGKLNYRTFRGEYVPLMCGAGIWKTL